MLSVGLRRNMDEIRIVPTGERYADGFNAVVDAVARERRYIGFVEGPSLESTREFVRSILGGAGVQLLAVKPNDVVVGWCDIVRNPREGFRHVGRLGMGLLPGYRGRGLGRRLVAQILVQRPRAGDQFARGAAGRLLRRLALGGQPDADESRDDHDEARKQQFTNGIHGWLTFDSRNRELAQGSPERVH